MVHVSPTSSPKPPVPHTASPPGAHPLAPRRPLSLSPLTQTLTSSQVAPDLDLAASHWSVIDSVATRVLRNSSPPSTGAPRCEIPPGYYELLVAFRGFKLCTCKGGIVKPGVAVKHCKEGTESFAFWFALGGKQRYTNRNVTHLSGRLEVVTRVFNFSQDDLLSEDMTIPDTYAEVFVSMGQCMDSKDKQKALKIGQA